MATTSMSLLYDYNATSGGEQSQSPRGRLWKEVDGSGFDPMFFTTLAYNESGQLQEAVVYNCDVWSMPSRIVLQFFILIMLLLNIAAAFVVFGVPTNVRGKHVSFLFGCVRVLNILDIWQCAVLFFCPFMIPNDCQPDVILCDITGYMFAITTLFSPLVAIVMAVDRAVAVYFHVQYKANPRSEVKYACLAAILCLYGLYLLMPCFTEFGSYIAVSWLAVCSFEWGIQYRAFNLILGLITTLLILLLIAANLAILLKIHMRKKQIKKMKGNYGKKSQIKNGKIDKGVPAFPKGFELRKLHRSADDIIDISSDECSTFGPSNQASSFRKRLSKHRPPPLKIPTKFDHEQSNGFNCTVDIVKPVPSPLARITSKSSTPPLTPIPRAKTHSANARPLSITTPPTTTSLLFPLSPFGSGDRSPSPLIHSPGDSSFPMLRNLRTRSLNRSTSADNILNCDVPSSSFAHSIFPFPKPQTPTLLRQVLDYPTVKIVDGDNKRSSIVTKSSDECETPRRRPVHSSTSSFFSFAFSSVRDASFRIKRRQKKSKRIRKTVSRITKMTTAICMVFLVLYVPFMVRKLIQIIPAHYGDIYVPPGVEIATLFGPLLSPLCNPLIYVFLNPHYKDRYAKLIRKISIKCGSKSKSIYTEGKSKTRKPRKSRLNTTGVSSPVEKEVKSSQLEDVFESDPVAVRGSKSPKPETEETSRNWIRVFRRKPKSKRAADIN